MGYCVALPSTRDVTQSSAQDKTLSYNRPRGEMKYLIYATTCYLVWLWAFVLVLALRVH